MIESLGMWCAGLIVSSPGANLYHRTIYHPLVRGQPRPKILSTTHLTSSRGRFGEVSDNTALFTVRSSPPRLDTGAVWSTSALRLFRDTMLIKTALSSPSSS